MKLKKLCGKRGNDALVALVAVVLVVPVPARAQTKPQNKLAAKLQARLANAVISEGIDWATTQILGKEGDDGVTVALSQLTTEVAELHAKADNIERLLELESFTSAYQRAAQIRGMILSEAEKVEDWVTNDKLVTHDMSDRFLGNIRTAIIAMPPVVTDSVGGLIPIFMKNRSFASVSDLNCYWAEAEALRDQIVVSLAQAEVAVETARRHLEKKRQIDCPGSAAPGVVSWDYVGNACRGPGGANSESFYSLARNVTSLAECQARCAGQEWCEGVESGHNGTRCELWREPIATSKTVSGFQCYRKTQSGAGSQEPSSPGDPNCDVPSISAETKQSLFAHVKSIVEDMYAWGVPLVEDRGEAKFVHAKGQPWALSPPRSGSGYFGTATGTRVLGKLQTLASAYTPHQHQGKTLEAFLEENQIPTRFLDQSSWKCNELCGVGGCDLGWYVSVRADMVVGDAVTSKTIVLSPKPESRPECDRRLAWSKTRAGKNYWISGGKPTGGLWISEYSDGFVDSAFWENGVPIASGVTPVNRPFFGRFFTYNLTVDDCKRMCRAGPTTAGCQYCDRADGQRKGRLNVGDRAALRSERAVRDYLKALSSEGGDAIRSTCARAGA